jgi:eukaryotic-like serine/threonine-protein kinase
MNSHRWERVKELFEAALERAEPERSPFLLQACQNDVELRLEVESLLSGERKAGDFMLAPLVPLPLIEPARDSPPTTFSPGEIISGRFKVVRFIGRGGMGEVYEARDLDLGERVALKTIRQEIASDPKMLARFKREILLARRVTHANVCRLFDLEQYRRHQRSGEAAITFLTMELLEGETLTQRLQRQGRMPAEEALPIIQQMAEALAAAHEAGIVHRDFKPGNVMLVAASGTGETRTRAVVTDFGLACAVEPQRSLSSLSQEDSSSLTGSGGILGTLDYMAPEQIEGGEVSPATDIYALGLVIYEMATAYRPFQGGNGAPLASLIKRLKEPPPSPRVRVPDLDPRWERMVLQCLEIDPARRFTDARDLITALGRPLDKTPSVPIREKLLQSHSAQQDHSAAALKKSRLRMTTLGVSVLLAMGAPLIWRWVHPPPPRLPQELTRITQDSGLTSDPTISADGKLVAYSSDRGEQGNLHIWVQHISSRSAMQITHDNSDATQPALSPDGEMVAFRSEREGGGIYVAPVLGGSEHLIAPKGRYPRFSPDGTQILYWTGEEGNLLVPTGKIFVVAAGGGVSRQLQPKLQPQLPPQFADARYPAWSPDGKHVIFQGTRDASLSPEETSDWWVMTPDGSQLFKTGAFEILRQQQLELYGCSIYWSGDHVIFAARLGYSTNLWQASLSSRDWKISAPPQRLTSGTAMEVSPWVSSSGRLVFSSVVGINNIWSLSTGREQNDKREFRRVTSGVGIDTRPSVSADGTKLVFARRTGDMRDVWFKNLSTEQEAPLTLKEETVPIISRDGTQVAYSTRKDFRRPIYVVDLSGGVPQQVCPDCGDVVDWSPDGKSLLYVYGQPTSVNSLDIASGRSRIFLRRTNFMIDQAQMSPRGDWVAFVQRVDADHSKICLAPVQNGVAVAEDRWVEVTNGRAWDDKPRWSQDASKLFIYSNRDGFGCIWRIKLNPATKLPEGDPVAVKHLHSPGLSFMNFSQPAINLSVGGEKLFFNLGEVTGNIWMMESKTN